MLKLIPSKNPDIIMSFIKGPGLLKRCSGGIDLTGVDAKEAIRKSNATFLVATEDGLKGYGFVMFKPEGGSAVSVHLCLRTAGERTRRIFALAIHYAKLVMGATTVHAVFPESYRGCQRLAKSFNFKDDPTLKPYYAIKSVLPYAYKRLDIN
jgi:hypothetical protein